MKTYAQMGLNIQSFSDKVKIQYKQATGKDAEQAMIASCWRKGMGIGDTVSYIIRNRR